jgi:hypothetical protein
VNLRRGSIVRLVFLIQLTRRANSRSRIGRMVQRLVEIILDLSGVAREGDDAKRRQATRRQLAVMIALFAGLVGFVVVRGSYRL